MPTVQEQAVEQPIPGRSEWRNAFAEELIRLAPRLNPDAADEFSDSQYLVSGDLTPGSAASAFASLHGYSVAPPEAVPPRGELRMHPR